METEKKVVEAKEVKTVAKTEKVRHTPKAMEAASFRGVPDHITQLAGIVMYNAEIRRHTSHGILNYLRSKGQLSGEKGYVKFLANKFSVRSRGLAREYFYTERFFLVALIASFSSFAKTAEDIISNFVDLELNQDLDKMITKEEQTNVALETLQSLENSKNEDNSEE